jgi:hypothetical protein
MTSELFTQRIARALQDLERTGDVEAIASRFAEGTEL